MYPLQFFSLCQSYNFWWASEIVNNLKIWLWPNHVPQRGETCCSVNRITFPIEPLQTLTKRSFFAKFLLPFLLITCWHLPPLQLTPNCPPLDTPATPELLRVDFTCVETHYAYSAMWRSEPSHRLPGIVVNYCWFQCWVRLTLGQNSWIGWDILVKFKFPGNSIL